MSDDRISQAHQSRVEPSDFSLSALRMEASLRPAGFVHRFSEVLAERDRYRAALEDAYSHLTDGEGLGPDCSLEAVELARECIAKALIP